MTWVPDVETSSMEETIKSMLTQCSQFRAKSFMGGGGGGGGGGAGRGAGGGGGSGAA